MKKSKILQIMMIAWILLFVAFAVYKLINAPKICWEPGINPVTKESHGKMQAWNAGMFILAYESLRKRRVLL